MTSAAYLTGISDLTRILGVLSLHNSSGAMFQHVSGHSSMMSYYSFRAAENQLTSPLDFVIKGETVRPTSSLFVFGLCPTQRIESSLLRSLRCQQHGQACSFSSLQAFLPIYILSRFVSAPMKKGGYPTYLVRSFPGSVDPSGDLGKGISTHCYASDIANRLTGWVMAPHDCYLDGA